MSNARDLYLSEQDLGDINYDGFYDGVNKIIPDNTELTCAVTGGFEGMEEGQAKRTCFINIVITTPGEFFGQKYKYNAKVWDVDASKRDLAYRNLGVLDAQAGFPMHRGKLELTTENIEKYWAGTSEARVKFAMFMSDPEKEDDGKSREINFIRGFGYLREKMVQPTPQDISEQDEEYDEVDIDF